MVRLCAAESAIATCKSCKPNRKTRALNAHQPLLRRFSYSELESATSGFSPSALLGKGSGGSVYRAALDSGKLIAAVKRCTLSSSSGPENEIEILSKLHRPGLVNLLGYGVEPGTNRVLLVVEYMPNGSLYDLLHKSSEPPGWTGRVRFALQVARAVAALHESNPPVIHRDVKSSNVLIDGLRRARLGDFGLALRGHVEDVRALSTPPAGTLGYLDPCYLAPADLSAKSDVFSFGILLLEIISGRRAIDVHHSPPSVEEWALPLIKAGSYEEICDRRIRSPADRGVIREMARLAIRCTRSTVEKRPAMADVVDSLRGTYKRVRSPVRRLLVRSRPLIGCDSFEGEEVEEQVQVRRSRHGSRRSLSRSRKVSCVATTEEIECAGMQETTRGSGPVVGRSESLKSAGLVRVGSEVNRRGNNGINEGKGKVGPDFGLKIGAVKMRKSRSVGAGVGKFENLLDIKNGGDEAV